MPTKRTPKKAPPKRARRSLAPEQPRRVGISVRVDSEDRAWLQEQLAVLAQRSPTKAHEADVIRLLVEDQRRAGWTVIAAAQRKVDAAGEPPALEAPSK